MQIRSFESASYHLSKLHLNAITSGCAVTVADATGQTDPLVSCPWTGMGWDGLAYPSMRMHLSTGRQGPWTSARTRRVHRGKPGSVPAATASFAGQPGSLPGSRAQPFAQRMYTQPRTRTHARGHKGPQARRSTRHLIRARTRTRPHPHPRPARTRTLRLTWGATTLLHGMRRRCGRL